MVGPPQNPIIAHGPPNWPPQGFLKVIFEEERVSPNFPELEPQNLSLP